MSSKAATAPETTTGPETGTDRLFDCTDAERDAFTNGDCLFFATELAAQTGGEVCVFCYDDGYGTGWLHAVCRIEDGIFDITGKWDSPEEVAAAYRHRVRTDDLWLAAQDELSGDLLASTWTSNTDRLFFEEVEPVVARFIDEMKLTREE